MEVLKITGLSFAYTNSNKKSTVLDNISLQVQEGESVGLIGANGVGKSTLLKLITGLLDIQEGEIVVNGSQVCKKNLKSVRKDIGYVFQDSDSQLFMSTVYEDVAFGPRNYGFREEEVDSMVMKALKEVHIEDLAERQTYRLSGGEKKLASIATVLALDAKVILMDEPTVALDPRNRRNLINTVNSLNCAKLIATHDLDFVLDTCSRVILLGRDGICASGDTKTILKDKSLLEGNGLELPLSLQRL